VEVPLESLPVEVPDVGPPDVSDVPDGEAAGASSCSLESSSAEDATVVWSSSGVGAMFVGACPDPAGAGGVQSSSISGPSSSEWLGVPAVMAPEPAGDPVLEDVPVQEVVGGLQSSSVSDPSSSDFVVVPPVMLPVVVLAADPVHEVVGDFTFGVEAGVSSSVPSPDDVGDRAAVWVPAPRTVEDVVDDVEEVEDVGSSSRNLVVASRAVTGLVVNEMPTTLASAIAPVPMTRASETRRAAVRLGFTCSQWPHVPQG
jgi:hypothetical protein